MDISESAIWSEIEAIRDSGPTEVHHYWDCIVSLPNEQLTVDKVIGIEVKRNYLTKFADEAIIVISMSKTVYDNQLFPNKDDFHVTIFKDPIGEINNEADFSKAIYSRRYRGILAENQSTVIEGYNKTKRSPDDIDKSLEIRIQLIDPAIELLRMKSVGGIYRNMTPGDVVRGIFSFASGDLGLDTQSSVKGVDMVGANNQEVREHVIIPHGTMFTDVARYVQEEAGGIYGAGIGYYMQTGMWYIYPEYDIYRYENTPKALTVINVPKSRLPGIERTYSTDGQSVFVIATGNTQQADITETLQLNLGNGVRFVNARKILGDYYTVDGNKAIARRSDNVSEVTLGVRKTGLNQTLMSKNRITDNPFRETSELSKRVGTNLRIDWQNCDPDLIYPGMPVRYVYVHKDNVEEVYGIVTGASHNIYLKGKGMTTRRHACDMSLEIYVKLPEST